MHERITYSQQINNLLEGIKRGEREFSLTVEETELFISEVLIPQVLKETKIPKITVGFVSVGISRGIASCKLGLIIGLLVRTKVNINYELVSENNGTLQMRNLHTGGVSAVLAKPVIRQFPKDNLNPLIVRALESGGVDVKDIFVQIKKNTVDIRLIKLDNV